METQASYFDHVMSDDNVAFAVPELKRCDATAASPTFSPTYKPGSPTYGVDPDSKVSGRSWCVTYPNYSEDDYHRVISAFRNEKVRYGIVGKEVGGQTGLPHLQIFISFRNSVRFSAVKKIFPGCHIEKAVGTAEQNIAYCSKDGSFEEVGDRPLTSEFLLFELEGF